MNIILSSNIITYDYINLSINIAIGTYQEVVSTYDNDTNIKYIHKILLRINIYLWLAIHYKIDPCKTIVSLEFIADIKNPIS